MRLSALLRGGDALCVAIRRETKNVWERRAPLAPSHVKALTAQGIRVLIQPSGRRAIPIHEYTAAGAEEAEDVSGARLIVGMKEIAPALLLPDRAYAFFSHTIKAQHYNMAMLDDILRKNICMLDYEVMVQTGSREQLVGGASGVWAGRVGMLDILHGLGLRLLALGFETPLLHAPIAHNYRNLKAAEEQLGDAGRTIAERGLPDGLPPFITLFTGTGHVSRGAQDILRFFPHEFVDVSDLPEVAKSGSRHKLYGCVVSRQDHLVRKDGAAYDQDEYYKQPQLYRSTFAQKIAPYASVIVNGIVWLPGQRRLLTNDDVARLLAPDDSLPRGAGGLRLPHRLLAISDVSADEGGSLQFLTNCTSVDKPFFIFDVHADARHVQTDCLDVERGVLVCSVENMPTQMAPEATQFFGDHLAPYIPDMLKCDPATTFEQLADMSDVVKNAVMTMGGQLTPRYAYIADLRKELQAKRPNE